MSYSLGDVLDFVEYIFTDNGAKRSHMALVLLPMHLTQYQNNIWCAVITSKPTKHFAAELTVEKNPFFSVTSYACFSRKDLQPLSGLRKKIQQPIGRVHDDDLQACFRHLRGSLYALNDVNYLVRAAMMREWKKVVRKTPPFAVTTQAQD